jgi:hypothetical protein
LAVRYHKSIAMPPASVMTARTRLLSGTFGIADSLVYRSGIMGHALSWFRWIASWTAIATLSTAASANGRYPRGQYLKEAISDPNSLVLSATYGLLVTNDR